MVDSSAADSIDCFAGIDHLASIDRRVLSDAGPSTAPIIPIIDRQPPGRNGATRPVDQLLEVPDQIN
jgi:hypothetical protein